MRRQPRRRAGDGLRLQSSLAPLLYRLYPVVVHYADAETAAPLDPEASAVESEAEARDVLTASRTASNMIRESCSMPHSTQPDLAALQRQLGIPLREFNATLSTLGARYPAIDYSQQHAEDFSDHLRRHRDRLLDRLRWARLGSLHRIHPPTRLALAAAHRVHRHPRPEWGTTVGHSLRSLMDERVEEELTRLLGAAPPASGPPLPRLSDCAKANADLVNSAASTLVKIVRAWLVRQGKPIGKSLG